MPDHEYYMRRALQLARNGRLDAHPNPMVGAVIVSPSGRIIGEGWHRRCGEAHAEVNAVNSVSHKELLRDATMYVTLEPCSHYGKTPPCAEMIVREGIPRVVVGCLDPFVKVSGRGVAILKNAGVDVTVGVLEADCRALNVRFMTAHELGRPYVILKWAESADGFIDGQISGAVGRMMVHHLRATVDAIMIGSGTALTDDPLLDVRCFCGKEPLRVIMDSRGRVNDDAKVFRDDNVVRYSEDCGDLNKVLSDLYRRGVTSLLVEGGAELLKSFLSLQLYDEIRIEQSPNEIHGSVRAPKVCL